MPRTLRALAGAGAIVCLIAGSAVGQIEYTNNFRFNSGQSVQPIFEGWSRLADGSFNVHFGYLNRNYVEQPHIPIGVNNNIEPGGPDRGQPTYFYPRTNRNLFTVSVPSDWDRQREVVWTLTVNGKTERAHGWLQPEWEIDPDRGAFTISRAFGNTNPERQRNRPPTLAIEPIASLALGEKASLVAVVTDDGLPEPSARSKPAVGQETPPTLQGGDEAPINVPEVDVVGAPNDGGPRRLQGLRVSWMVWRGPADASFSPRTAPAQDGKAVTTITFAKPGDYVLRGTVTDGEASLSKSINLAVR